MLKVTIYTGGFFHLPIVTEAVRKSFSEVALHSSYPGFYLKKKHHEGIDLYPHICKEIASKFPIWCFSDRPYQLSQIFQNSIKGSLKNLTSDLVIGWAGHTLSVAEVCAVKQIPFLLERGSTHIRWQRERLKIAYKNAGLPENDAEVPSEKYVVAQEKEYELANRIHVPTPLCLRSFEKY